MDAFKSGFVAHIGYGANKWIHKGGLSRADLSDLFEYIDEVQDFSMVIIAPLDSPAGKTPISEAEKELNLGNLPISFGGSN